MSLLSRPRLTLRPSRLDRSLAAASGLIIMAAVVWVALNWQAQAHVALRSNTAGGRGSQVFLLVLMLFIFAGLGGLARIPEQFKFPIPVTAANAPRLYALAVTSVGWARLLMLTMIGTLLGLAVPIAMNDNINGWWLSVALIPLVVSVVIARNTARLMRRAA